ncbi:MAG: ComEC/Rec2 family competence protein, partial [Pyrinomonadaceae bacterium]
HYLARQTSERFRAGGTFHLLVISGGHISIIGIIAIAIARSLTDRRLWQFIAAATLLWIYTIAVGADPSVVRASIMFSFAALAPVFFRRANRFNTLAAGCLVLLIWKPGNLFDPSFLLTFLSVVALVAIAWPVSTRLKAIGGWRPSTVTPYPPRVRRFIRVLAETLFWSERSWKRDMENYNYSYELYKTRVASMLEFVHLQRPLRYLFVALIATLSVQVILMPIEVSYFHRISISGFMLNLFVGILLAAVSVAAFFALLIGQLWTRGATLFSWLAEKFNWLMIHSIDPFRHVGLDALRLPAFVGWKAKTLYFLFYLAILLLMITLAQWNPFKPFREENRIERQERTVFVRHRLTIMQAAVITLLLTIFLILIHPMIAPRADGRLHVDFIDVGQGDSALVTMPDGTTLLIDGGGRPDFSRRLNEDAVHSEISSGEIYQSDRPSVGEAVVSEYLWWKGLDHVDYILATHADTDHIDGLTFVARDFKVKAAFVGRTPERDVDFIRFASMLHQRAVPLFVLGRGDKFRLTTGQGEVSGEFLWPLPSSANNNHMIKNANDESLILRLKFGDRSFLFTGDAGLPVEDWLIANNDNLHADVIKVSHHGSRTASGERFVTTVSPRTAIISVGLDSPYHHPHGEVIKRWRDAGAEVLTTGQRGTISISTNGHDLITETFVQ